MRNPRRHRILYSAILLSVISVQAFAELGNDPIDWDPVKAAPIIAAWCAERVPAEGSARVRCQTAQTKAGNSVSILARRFRPPALESQLVDGCRRAAGDDQITALECANRKLTTLQMVYTPNARKQIARRCRDEIKGKGGNQSLCELRQTTAAVNLAGALSDAADGSPQAALIQSCITMAASDFVVAAQCAMPQTQIQPNMQTAPIFGAPLQ